MTGYRLIGFLDGGFGLAIASRNTLTALGASARPVVPIAIDDRTRRTALARGAEGGASPRDVNLFHMNPIEIVRTRKAWSGALSPSGACVCVPFWELPVLPRRWEAVLDGMDAVLAPTRFVQAACTRVLGGDRVLHYPQAVFVPRVTADRAAWGLPTRATLFIVAFDVGSDADRKNPLAAIDAFQLAFPTEQDVVLVIKTKPYPDIPAFQDHARMLRERISGDPRIRILERALTYEEVLGLYASCDVMVSTHRSEGLGLHLMEAMSLGRPVVGTGWSGNMDFMTPENSVATRYRLVPVQARHPGYLAEVGRDGQVWAEPELQDVAEALRALHREPGRRLELGRNAARDMERRREELLSGGTFDALERQLATPAGPPQLWPGVRKTARVLRAEKLRDRLGRLARLLRLRP